MKRRGRLVYIFGTPKLVKTNPWALVGMSKKSHYLATPMPWCFDKTKFSAAQLAAQKRFAEVVREVSAAIPSDGTFTTLQKRVRSIGEKLRGAVYPGRKPIVIPKYASEAYKAQLQARIAAVAPK